MSDDTAEKLARRLHEFNAADLLVSDRDLEVKGRLLIYDEHSLSQLLKSRRFKIHKGCYDRYNKTRFDKALGVKRKRIDREEARLSRTISTRAQSSPTVSFKEMLCMFCGGRQCIDKKHPERSKLLHAAASWKVLHPNVQEFSDNLRMMASKLQDSAVLTMLDTDVRSAELYYHLLCYNEYCKR